MVIVNDKQLKNLIVEKRTYIKMRAPKISTSKQKVL